MNYELTVQAGQMQLGSLDQVRHFEESFRRAVRIEDHAARLQAVSEVIAPPIRKVAPYLEWTQHFFTREPGDQYSFPRIPLDEYTLYAFFSSPDGGIEYTRPYRKYATVSFRSVRCGVEIPWDADRWGWNVISQKMMEAAEELARRRDDVRRPLLDSAAVSQAGHIPTVATALSKDSVDNIIKSAATNGFPVTQVAVNIGTLMDMSGWTLSSNSMIAGAVPERVANDILTRLFWNGYGNLLWIANHTIPSDYLYFSGPPSQVGYWFESATRTASAPDIDHDLDKHNWRQSVAAYLGGSHNVWRLQIT